MRKLDQRGVAAFEFCIVCVPLFTLMFVIFDLGRYALTQQSLRVLADAEARAWMIQCGTPAALGISANCVSDYLSAAQKQAVAPFLYAGGLTPSVSISTGASPRTFTAWQPGFTTLMPILSGSLSAPSASTSIPF
jgi:Flp pilus assembly protein TadG